MVIHFNDDTDRFPAAISGWGGAEQPQPRGTDFELGVDDGGLETEEEG